MKALLADDDDIVLSLLQRFAEMAGYEPLLAANGGEALEILEAERVHVVVTDLVMPIMDGRWRNG